MAPGNSDTNEFPGAILFNLPPELPFHHPITILSRPLDCFQPGLTGKKTSNRPFLYSTGTVHNRTEVPAVKIIFVYRNPEVGVRLLS